MDKILVTLIGVLGIAATYWFFLMKKEQEVKVSDSVDIIVSGGYSPEVISIPSGKTTRLNFIREEQSSCTEEVVLPDFKIKKFLPYKEKVTVEITPQQKGEYTYSCGMNMVHGKIIVE